MGTRSDRIKVNFFQPTLYRYRHDFFESLATRFPIDISVISGGDASGWVGPKAYNLSIFPARKAAGFNIQGIPKRVYSESDVNVVGFDLHWPEPILRSLHVRRDIPLVFWGHGRGKSSLAWSLKKILLRRCEAFVAYSEGRATDVRAANANTPVYVANNTIRVENIGDSSMESKKYFIYVGRLQPRKDIEAALIAFARYVRGCKSRGKRYLDFVLVGAGDPAYESALRKIVTSEGVADCVRFLGPVHCHHKLKGLFSHACAYVSPGDVGLGALHSFAYGVPVLTIRDREHGPEFEALRHGYNSFVLDHVDDLVEAFEELDGDVPLARSLGRSAFATYKENYLPERMEVAMFEALQMAARSGANA